jgi:putative endonuclease
MSPVRPPWFYTYVLKCDKTKTFYTGTTNNLIKRLEEHSKGKVYSTKNKLPVNLIYAEACLNGKDAYRRENI